MHVRCLMPQIYRHRDIPTVFIYLFIYYIFLLTIDPPTFIGGKSTRNLFLPCVAQADAELVTPLPQLLECGNYRCGLFCIL